MGMRNETFGREDSLKLGMGKRRGARGTGGGRRGWGVRERCTGCSYQFINRSGLPELMGQRVSWRRSQRDERKLLLEKRENGKVKSGWKKRKSKDAIHAKTKTIAPADGQRDREKGWTPEKEEKGFGRGKSREYGGGETWKNSFPNPFR